MPGSENKTRATTVSATADVDTAVLAKLVTTGLANLKKQWLVTKS